MILDILYSILYLDNDTEFQDIENILSDFENILNFEDTLHDLASIIIELVGELL